MRFAASFVWADLRVEATEQTFLATLACELDLSGEEQQLLLRPPRAEHVDPTRVAPRLASLLREVALRAIAADGRVAAREMAMFDLLDELLPAPRAAPPTRRERPRSPSPRARSSATLTSRRRGADAP